MSDKKSNSSDSERLLSAIAESVLEATDEEILSEVEARGDDPNDVAAHMDALFESAILSRKKERLTAAAKRYEERTQANSNIGQLVFSKFKNAVEALNAWVELKTKMGMPNTVFQFKDFKNMTESDADKILHELVRLGEIDRKDL